MKNTDDFFERYEFFKEMPDWLVLRHWPSGIRNGNGGIRLGRCEILRRGYTFGSTVQYVRHSEMPPECPRKKCQLIDGKFTDADGEHYQRMGIVQSGVLYSEHVLGERPYFGANVLQAIRYIFLLTQKPIIKNEAKVI